MGNSSKAIDGPGRLLVVRLDSQVEYLMISGEQQYGVWYAPEFLKVPR